MRDEPTTVQDEFVSLSDAARERGCARNALMYHIAHGNLKAEKIAGRLVIRRTDLDQFIGTWKPRRTRIAC